MTYWTDGDGAKIALSVGIACSRGRQGAGCRRRYFILRDAPGRGEILDEPDVSQCRDLGEAERIVGGYAAERGWETHEERDG